MNDYYDSYGRSHQSAAAQQDHEDDEGLKVVVFHDGETGSPDVRPDLPSAARRVYVQEGTAAVTLWRVNNNKQHMLLLVC